MAVSIRHAVAFGAMGIRRLFTRRLAPYLGAITIAILAQIVHFDPTFWRSAFFLAWGVVFAVGFTLRNRERTESTWWHTLFRPFFFTTWSLGLLLFLGTPLARHTLILTLATLLIFFWENVWRFAWAPARYNPEALENVSIALNTVTLWFAGNFFFTLLLDPSIVQFQSGWLTELFREHVILIAVAVVLISAFLMDYRTIWVARYDAGKVRLLLIVTSLLIGEMFWVLNFMPHRVEVKSFFLVLFYYLLTNLGRAHLDGNLTGDLLRRYGYLSLLALLTVLISAKWLI